MPEDNYYRTLGDTTATIASAQTNAGEGLLRHHQQKEVAVFIPVLQALMFGLLAAFAVVSWIWLSTWQHWITWFLVILFNVSAVGYVALTWSWLSVVWKLETVFRMDFNRDNLLGEPPQPTEPTRMIVELREGRHTGVMRVPPGERRLIDLALGTLNRTRPFSERNWAGLNNPYSLNEFRELRRQFLTQNLVIWVNDNAPTAGATWTETGVRFLEQVLRSGGYHYDNSVQMWVPLPSPDQEGD